MALFRRWTTSRIPMAGLAIVAAGLIAGISVVMSQIAALVVVYLALLTTPIVVQWCRGGMFPFRPDFFVSLMFACYTLPVPFDVLFFGNTWGVDDGLVLKGLALSICWSGAFLIGYFVTSRRVEAVVESQALASWTPWLLIGIGLLLYAVYLYSSFGSIGNYLFAAARIDRFAISAGKGFFTIGIFLVNGGWILQFAMKLKEIGNAKKKVAPFLVLHLVAFAVYAAFFLLAGDRRAWVSLAIGLVFVYAAHRFQKGFPMFRFFFGCVVAIALLQIFSKTRGYASSPLDMWDYTRRNFEARWFNLADGEFGYQFRILVDVLHATPAYKAGWTYVEAVVAQIPSFLVPSRPEALSTWYAAAYYPDIHAAGGSLAFSAVGEAFMNFGVAGPIVIGYLLGSFLKWWWQRTGRHVDSAYHLALYGAGLSAVLILPRADSTSFLKQFLFASVLPLVLVHWFQSVVTRRTVMGGQK